MKYAAKRVLDWLQSAYVFGLRLLGMIDYPVPPNSSMRKTSSTSIAHYFRSGIETYLPIAVAALSNGIDMNEGARVLDFGCGVGRQLLHFTRRFPDVSFLACDVDQHSVDFVGRSFPGVSVLRNDFSPPLPYADSAFDLVYAVSVFSHLSREDQALWLDELARVTRVGGLCVLTTEGRRALGLIAADFGESAEAVAQRLERDGYAYFEYDDFIDDDRANELGTLPAKYAGIRGSYGSMLLTSRFVEEHWASDRLELVGIAEGVIDSRQDMIVLRRRR